MGKVITDDRRAFEALVGILWEEDLVFLPFQPMLPPTFVKSELSKLQAFVREHPAYHIVSVMNEWREINRFDVSARFWFLADGDADAEIEHVTTPFGRARRDKELVAALRSRMDARQGAFPPQSKIVKSRL